jgi:uncharacterized protein
LLSNEYDVVIVGAGPAGIFAALELVNNPNLRVLVLEKGKGLEKRHCPIVDRGLGCVHCRPCDQVSGWGGAGAFSDGKLTLSPNVGGHMAEYVGKEKLQDLVKFVDDGWVRFGAEGRVYGGGDEVDNFARRASLADLRLIPMYVRHMGTERSFEILANMRDFLAERVEIRTRTAVAEIVVEDGTIKGVITGEGEAISCKYLIVAPGREGADWLTTEARRLKISLKQNPVDVGVRVEIPSAVMEELTSVLYEPKLELYTPSFDDRIRTFCVCPHGEVTTEYTAGSDPVITVNGHSYHGKQTNNTNFALLVSTTFTEPFREPIAYGRYIARLANILSTGIIVQRLGDLLAGRRSTPERIQRGLVEPTLKGATPGDLSFVLPYRYLTDIVEMLRALDKLAPGVYSRHTLLYGVEVKFYSSRLQVGNQMESPDVKNMFAIGDGAGITRGLVQASASGVVAAREILSRA